MVNHQRKQTINPKKSGRKNNYEKLPYKKISKGQQQQQQEHYKQERLKKIEEKRQMRARKAAELAEEKERIRQQKEQRILECKKKRLQKTKAYSKRTKYGQPVMKDRMQLLLKQIEQMKGGNS